MVDSSKTSNAHTGDESLPLFDRQTHLASLVGDMMSNRRQQGDHGQRGTKKQTRVKAKGGLARGILQRDVGCTNLSSPRGVVVPASADVQYTIDAQIDALCAARDERALRYEQGQLERVSASVAGVQKFLHEALAGKTSENLLRKSNLLTNNRTGRNAGYGWAIDGLLKDQIGLSGAGPEGGKTAD